MSWSYKITFLYLGFVLMILGFVYAATQQHHDLVTEDYYAQELAYETRIQQIKRANALEQPFQLKVDKGTQTLTLRFPNQSGLNGTIKLYRPDEAAVDEAHAIAVNPTFEQSLPTQHLKKGLWRVQVEWKAEGKSYYQEDVIVI